MFYDLPDSTDADIVDRFNKIWTAVRPGFHTASTEKYHCANLIYAAHGLRIFHSVFITEHTSEWIERLIIISPDEPTVADRLIFAHQVEYYDESDRCEPIWLNDEALSRATQRPSVEAKLQCLQELLIQRQEKIEHYESRRSILIHAVDHSGGNDNAWVLELPNCYGVKV